jgi:hypothetical protein
VGSNPATPTPANRRSGALIAGLLFCFVGQIGPYNCGVQQCVSTIEARPNRLSASRVTVQDDAAESGDEAASCWQAVFRCFVPSSASCRRVLRAVECFVPSSVSKSIQPRPGTHSTATILPSSRPILVAPELRASVLEPRC